jgi:uncharacterized membrane protein YccC
MGVTAAARAGLAASWLAKDPGVVALRRAARAALVLPIGFAFAKFVTGDPQVEAFVAFGCFALIVMAGFGGARLHRAAAYVTTTFVGAALVALGTLASPSAGIAALAMLLLGFGIQFMGALGGYVKAATPALLLAFILALSLPAPPAAIGPRLAGWLLAGALATLAGVFLWPYFEQLALQRRAADACRSVAELVRCQYESPGRVDPSPQLEAAREAVDAARHEYAAVPAHRVAPMRRHRALAELISDLQSTLEFAARPFGRQLPAARPSIEEGDRLAAAVLRTLEASAGVLTGGGPQPDLRSLDEARNAHRVALNRWAAGALPAGRSPEEVLEGLDAHHALRVLSYLTLALAANATIAAGGRLGAGIPIPAGTPHLEGATGTLIGAARTIRTHLEPTSSVLQNSVRAAVGLSLAVLLARVLRLDHAFWVVLGALSVLRTSALATGRTTIQALAGTLAGFAVGAIFAVAAGANHAVLWAALPLTVFLAAYAASAIGFVVGQAAFTLNVITLFNLISPAGWRVGLARIEDVAVGAGISIVVGLLLWPRGARETARRAVVGMYRAVVIYLAICFDRLLGHGTREDAGRARSIAVQARDRAGEAFDQFLNEPPAKPPAVETGAFLIGAGTHAIMIGDIANIVADGGYQAQGCAEGSTALRGQTQVMVDAFLRVADWLESATGAHAPHAGTSDEVLHEASLACLRRWREDPEAGRSAIAAVSAAELLGQLGVLVADLEEPAAAAAGAGRVPWWR